MMKISDRGRISILLLILLINNQALALEFLVGNEENGEEAANLLGKLIYGDRSFRYGDQVSLLDLQSGEKRILSNWPPVDILSLSKISETRILVSLKEFAESDRYDRVKKYDKSKFPDNANKYWVAVYDLLNDELKIVREGTKAAYWREGEKILYYSPMGDALIIASLDGSGEDDQIINLGTKLGHSEANRPIQVSGTEFLYASGSYGVSKYDFKSESVRHQDKLRCWLGWSLWIDNMQQLLCRVPAEKIGGGSSYTLTDLAGNISKKFLWGNPTYRLPIIGIYNSDNILVERGSLHIGFDFKEGLIIGLPNYRVELYNLKSGQKKEIINRSKGLYAEMIVWADE